MKKTLLLLTTALFGFSFQAEAVTLKGYTSLKAGYASMKHQTREDYVDQAPIKNNWNGDAGIGSVAFGLKAGYLRAEVEGNATSTTKETKQFHTENYTNVTTTTSHINTTSVMFNSYLELPVDFPLRPYISTGAGMAHIKGKFKSRSAEHNDQISSVNLSSNHFAWQIGAGLAYEITPNWAMDLGYRFMNYGSIVKKIYDYSETKPEYVGKVRLDAKVYSAYVGLRYTF